MQKKCVCQKKVILMARRYRTTNKVSATKIVLFVLLHFDKTCDALILKNNFFATISVKFYLKKN
jgi:hypothetical protein